jgi:DTW domain-containing protein YfiP
MSLPEPRHVCLACRRPESACYCEHVCRIETRSRVVLLQHPRERDMPLGTARMASLCLTNSELYVGNVWHRSRALQRALSDPERPPMLLFPSPEARDLDSDPPVGPITLIVADGTWSNSRKMISRDPTLSALPKLGFRAARPSEYRIRREPRRDYVSTIEALVHVLGVLEGDRARFEPMLAPFRHMIQIQVGHIKAHRGSPSRYARDRSERQSSDSAPKPVPSEQTTL